MTMRRYTISLEDETVAAIRANSRKERRGLHAQMAWMLEEAVRIQSTMVSPAPTPGSLPLMLPPSTITESGRLYPPSNVPPPSSHTTFPWTAGGSAPLNPEPDWVAIRHTTGDHPCGRTAFYVIRRIDPGRTSDASIDLIRKLDHSVPKPDEAPLCGGCGQPVDPYGSRDLDWGPALLREPTADDIIRVTNEKARARRAAAVAHAQTGNHPFHSGQLPTQTLLTPLPQAPAFPADPTEPDIHANLARISEDLMDPLLRSGDL